MRLELAITVPSADSELTRRLQHTMICDALCEYTVNVLRNNVDPRQAAAGAVGIDGTGAITCRNGITISEQLVASS